MSFQARNIVKDTWRVTLAKTKQNTSRRELGKQANLDFKFWFLQENAPDHDGNLNCASNHAVSITENKLFRFPIDFI